MKQIKFSFEREPVWIWVFSLLPAVGGLIVVLVLLLLRWLS